LHVALCRERDHEDGKRQTAATLCHLPNQQKNSSSPAVPTPLYVFIALMLLLWQFIYFLSGSFFCGFT
jgi:hypothetical protein